LGQVIDPELHRSITDLDMVGAIAVDASGQATIEFQLTTEACPLRYQLVTDIERVASALPGVTGVTVEVGTMNDDQRAALRDKLGAGAGPEIPFARPDSSTRVIAVASGKGGVGKSSITANLATTLSSAGHSVGVIDADIYGHSLPRLFGVEPDDGPTRVEGMDFVLPVTVKGVKLMSIGMMKPEPDDVIAWRGPVVSRALMQFLTEVYWGDLDFLLIDLPPGTGDVAMSIGQALPNAEILVVTTPQLAATEVAERAGTMADLMKQRVIGVIENMSYLDTVCPHCGQSHRVDVFGSDGGQTVATDLTRRLGYEVPLLGQIPLAPDWRAAGDAGTPLVLTSREPAAVALAEVAEKITRMGRALSPVG
jgi:ATP-binding protein involved in chromosome partitioning